MGDDKKSKKAPVTTWSMKIDEAIKLLFSSEKQALVMFINGALGKSHDPEAARLVELRTEFIRRKAAAGGRGRGPGPFDLERITADMMFALDGIAYHIEFQTTADRTIAIRIVGYGFEHALGNLRSGGLPDGGVIEVPAPVLIQIDEDKGIPDVIPMKLKVSGRGEALPLDITVVKLWEHDVEALKRKGFYLLLPFILVKHRKSKATPVNVAAFLEDLSKVEAAIADLYEKKRIRLNLVEDLHTVVDGIATSVNLRALGNSEEINKELRKMKNTRPLFSQEIRAEGIAEGIAEGEARGLAEGEARGEAKTVQIIQLYLKRKAPGEISKEVGEPIESVTKVLQASGVMNIMM